MNKDIIEFNIKDTQKRKRQILEAIIRLPDKEIEKLQKTGEDEYVLKQMVVTKRFHNRVCNRYTECPNYGTTKAYINLYLCQKCLCTWYCSAQCMLNDLTDHMKWCCNPKAEPDKGPLQIT